MKYKVFATYSLTAGYVIEAEDAYEASDIASSVSPVCSLGEKMPPEFEDWQCDVHAGFEGAEVEEY